jgi:nitrogen fixation protein FixH
MNWGYKLLVVFILFGGMILYMVYRCMNIPVDLVTKEYYHDEIAYQHVIDESNNANALKTKLTVKEEAGMIQIRFPQELVQDSLQGSLLFYSPSDSKKDRKITVSPDAEGLQQIAESGMQPGYYVVKIKWTAGKKHFYSEEPLTLH